MRCLRGLVSLGPRNLALVQRARLAIMRLAGILHSAPTCMRLTGAGDLGSVKPHADTIIVCDNDI